MKWIKILSWFFLFIFIGSIFLFFWIREKDKSQNLAHKKEREWKAHVEHAHMESYLHHYAEAEKEYHQLLEINPSDINIKIDLATVLYYQGKYTEASALLKTIPAEARNDKITLLAADIFLSEKKYLEAENLYREYLNRFPNDQETMIKLGKLLSWEKKYEEAIQLYQQVLAKDPQNIQIRRQYATVLIWMHKYQEATEELKKTFPQENQLPVNKE